MTNPRPLPHLVTFPLKLFDILDVQPKIDEICAKYEMGRAFIRPSGTEDICRLYVEAKKIEDVKAIQKEITEFILAHKEIN